MVEITDFIQESPSISETHIEERKYTLEGLTPEREQKAQEILTQLLPIIETEKITSLNLPPESIAVIQATCNILRNVRNLLEMPNLDTYNPEWCQAVGLDRNGYDSLKKVRLNWLSNGKLEPLTNTIVPPKFLLDLDNIFPIQHKLIEGIHAKVKVKGAYGRTLLETTRAYLVSQIFAEEQGQQGRELLQHYLPEFTPKEKTKFIGEPNRTHRSKMITATEYLGKFEDSHVIYIETTEDPYFNPYRPLLEYENNEIPRGKIVASHNLLHQTWRERHPEDIYLDDPEGKDMSEKDVTRLSIDYVRNFQQRRWREIKEVSGDKPVVSRLTGALNEAFAIGGEYILLFPKLIETPEFTMWADHYLDRRFRIEAQAEWKIRQDHHFDGYKIFGLLITVMEGKEALELILKADLNACKAIRSDSQLYAQFMKDPRLIPGIREHLRYKQLRKREPWAE